MTISQSVISKLWWGPFRRPFEAVVRRSLKRRTRILFGPLKGEAFTGGLSQILGIYELHLQEAIADKLREGNVFYDIGANNGFISLFGAKMMGERGQVYAFEPLPNNFEQLRKVVRDNKLSNCEPIQRAVSNSVGTAELYLEDDVATATPSLTNKGGGGKGLSVHTTTLDAFVSEHRWPNLIKLDVEGAEALVLQGALTVLSSDKAPTWIIEVHSLECDSAVNELLGSHNYHVKDLGSFRRNEYPRHIIAWKGVGSGN
jgi:FkbM family methyltransferase